MLSCLLAAALLQSAPTDVFLPSVPIHEVLLNRRYPAHIARPLEGAPAPQRPLDPAATRDHSLMGTLLDPEGEPLVGVVVGAVSLGPSGALLEPAAWRRSGLGYEYGERSPMRGLGFTDDAGAFRIEGLWPGRHQVYAVEVVSGADHVLPVLPAIASAEAQPAAGARYQLVGTFPGADRLGSDPDALYSRSDRKPKQGQGRVRMLLREPEGTLYVATSPIIVQRITRADGGAFVDTGEPMEEACFSALVQLDLKPGQYRAVIPNEEFPPRCGVDWIPRVPWLRPAECTFEVRANRVVAVEATFAPAGGVRIAFTDLPGVAPAVTPPIDPMDPGSCSRTREALLSDSTPRRVRVFHQRHPGGDKHALPQRMVACRFSVMITDYYLPDAQAVAADVLAPGRYLLTFEVDGAAIDPCWIEVAHGLVTDVQRALKAP